MALSSLSNRPTKERDPCAYLHAPLGDVEGFNLTARIRQFDICQRYFKFPKIDAKESLDGGREQDVYQCGHIFDVYQCGYIGITMPFKPKKRSECLCRNKF